MERNGCGHAYWMLTGSVIAPRFVSAAWSTSMSNRASSGPTLAQKKVLAGTLALESIGAMASDGQVKFLCWKLISPPAAKSSLVADTSRFAALIEPPAGSYYGDYADLARALDAPRWRTP